MLWGYLRGDLTEMESGVIARRLPVTKHNGMKEILVEGVGSAWTVDDWGWFQQYFWLLGRYTRIGAEKLKPAFVLALNPIFDKKISSDYPEESE